MEPRQFTRDELVKIAQEIDLDSIVPTTGCPRCDWTGYLIKSVGIDHPDFGKVRDCSCTIERRIREIVPRLMDESGLFEAGYEDYSFDTFENNRLLVGAMREYARDPQGWIVLRGPSGVGKTHLAVAIAKERVLSGNPAHIAFVPKLLRNLRDNFSPERNGDSTLFNRLLASPLLVIDDMGAQKSTEWAMETLLDLGHCRQVDGLATIVTTNLPDDQLAGRLGSRIKNTRICTIYEMGGSDNRALGTR